MPTEVIKIITSLLDKALNVWNEKLAEVWSLLTTSPENFKGGAIWGIVQQIYGSIQGVGYSLLVIFFLAGVIKTTTSPQDLRRPETMFKLFLRFVIAKAVVTYGMDILMAVMEVPQGMVGGILSTVGVGSAHEVQLPEAFAAAVEALKWRESIPLVCLSLICFVIIYALSFVLILTVYGRFFRFYMFAAIAPIPLAGLAGEGTNQMTRGFFRNYAAVCIEVVVIALACVIYSAIVGAPPVVDAESGAADIVTGYIVEVIFNMLVLVGTVKVCDRMAHELVGI